MIKAQLDRMKIYARLLFICFVVVFGAACNRDNPEPSVNDCRQGVYEIVQEWYLWKDRIPENFNPADHETPADVMEALRYKVDDRWSSVSDLEEFQQFFEEGTFVGFGIGLQVDELDNLWVTYAYKDGPAYEAGVRRGWRITEINGRNLEQIDDIGEAFGPSEEGDMRDLVFRNSEGLEESLTLTKRTVEINTVLHHQVFETNVGPVAYLAFKNFIETSREELIRAFVDFEVAGATELILDFRYNGGGRVDVATMLAGMIAPVGADNQVLLEYLHNDQKESENSSVLIDKTGGLEFSKVIILTTDGTASASELMINGLRPYMDVVTIGSNTHGKPVGSYGFQCGGEFAVSPIAFRVANADGVTDYFDGLEADFDSNDDLTRAFGDPEETMLKSALEYLETGGVTRAHARRADGYGTAREEALIRKQLPELSSF